MAAKQIPLTCPGHTRPVVDLDFSEDTDHGFFMISACKDGKPMLRQGSTGDWIGTFEGHKGAVWGVTLNKPATLAATAAADFSAKLWDAVKGADITTFAHKHIVKTVCFSQDDKRLLTGSNEKKMRIFDVETPEKDGIIIENIGGNPKSCLWSNNDQYILSGGEEKIIRQWDVRSLKETNTVTLDKALSGMQLSRDQSILCVASGNTAAFYDADSLVLLKQHEMKTNINSVSISPDNQIYVVGGEDFLLYKYNYEDGKQLESYHGHFGPVHCVRFSPDGQLYASGSEDGTLRLWQTFVGKTYGLWKAQADIANGNNLESEEKINNLSAQTNCNEIAVES